MPDYQKEAEEHWGQTTWWERSQQVVAAMTEQDWADLKQDHERFAADLAATKADDVAPGSTQAFGIVERHRGLVGRWDD